MKILNYFSEVLYEPNLQFLEKDFGEISLETAVQTSGDVVYFIRSAEYNCDLEFKGKPVYYRKHWNLIKFVSEISARSIASEALILWPFTPRFDFFVFLIFKVFGVRKPVILKLDANLDEIRRIYTGVAWPFSSKFAYRYLVKLSDLVLAETDGVNQFLKAHRAGNLLQFKNSISETALKYRKNYEDKKNTVIVIGRLSAPEKNIKYLKFKLRSLPPHWKVKFIGPIDQKLKTDIIRTNSEVSIEFLGHVANKRYIYKELADAKVLLSVSPKEGFPISFVEAAFMGLFIISSDVSGLDEVTDYGKYGCKFSLQSPEELSKHLKNIDSLTQRNSVKLSQQYEYVVENFITEKNVSKILVQLDNIARNNSPITEKI